MMLDNISDSASIITLYEISYRLIRQLGPWISKRKCSCFWVFRGHYLYLTACLKHIIPPQSQAATLVSASCLLSSLPACQRSLQVFSDEANGNIYKAPTYISDSWRGTQNCPTQNDWLLCHYLGKPRLLKVNCFVSTFYFPHLNLK